MKEVKNVRNENDSDLEINKYERSVKRKRDQNDSDLEIADYSHDRANKKRRCDGKYASLEVVFPYDRIKRKEKEK